MVTNAEIKTKLTALKVKEADFTKKLRKVKNTISSLELIVVNEQKVLTNGDYDNPVYRIDLIKKNDPDTGLEISDSRVLEIWNAHKTAT